MIEPRSYVLEIPPELILGLSPIEIANHSFYQSGLRVDPRGYSPTIKPCSMYLGPRVDPDFLAMACGIDPGDRLLVPSDFDIYRFGIDLRGIRAMYKALARDKTAQIQRLGQ